MRMLGSSYPRHAYTAGVHTPSRLSTNTSWTLLGRSFSMKKSRTAGVPIPGSESPSILYPSSPGGAEILVSLGSSPFKDQNSRGHSCWIHRNVWGDPLIESDA